MTIPARAVEQAFLPVRRQPRRKFTTVCAPRSAIGWLVWLVASLLVFLAPAATSLQAQEIDKPLQSIDDEITAFAFSPDGRIVYSVNRGFKTKQYDLEHDDICIQEAGGKRRASSRAKNSSVALSPSPTSWTPFAGPQAENIFSPSSSPPPFSTNREKPKTPSTPSPSKTMAAKLAPVAPTVSSKTPATPCGSPTATPLSISPKSSSPASSSPFVTTISKQVPPAPLLKAVRSSMRTPCHAPTSPSPSSATAP